MTTEDKEVPIEVKNLDLKIRFEQMDLRLKAMENENKVLRERFNGGQNKLSVERHEAQEKIEQYLKQIAELEAEKVKLIEEKKQIIDERDKSVAERDKEFRDKLKAEVDEKKDLEVKLGKARERLEELSSIDEKWAKYQQAMKDLEKERDEEKRMRSQEVNEKERQKIQATESLRKEMLYKIKETKANLLALNDEQLQTTTRLTILQNHQLTTELEYQSKQTE